MLTSPQKGGTASTRGTATARGGAVKRGAAPATRGGLRSKVAPSGVKPKEQKGDVTADTAQVEEEHHDGESAHLDDEYIPQEHEQEHENEEEQQHDQPGSANTTATLVDGGHDQLIVQEPEEHEDLSVFPKDDSSSFVHDEPDSVHDLTSEHHSTEDQVPPSPQEDDEPKVELEQQNPPVHNGAQDDLDDIVNFLESKPLFSSTATFATSESVGKRTAKKGGEDVDVAGEIPDEE